MHALGVAVEGCSEFMTPRMAEVWPFIEAGLQDGDASVRNATCTAVGCLCEWLEDDCVSKHAALVPVGVLLTRPCYPSVMMQVCLCHHTLGHYDSSK